MKPRVFLLLITVLLFATACCSGGCSRTPTVADSVSVSHGTVIPFIYYGHLYFPVVINDSVKANCIFDTGGDNLYLDSVFFNGSPLNTKNRSITYLRGIGNTAQKVNLIEDKYALSCGTLSLNAPQTFIMNIRSVIGKYADGVIGINLLKDSVFSIDYVKGEMCILKGSFPTEGYEQIPLSIRNNRIYLQATIKVTPQKNIEGEFLLDLGNGGSINLTSQCAHQNNLAQIVTQKTRTYTNWGGAGGASSSYSFRIDTFCIGTRKIAGPVVEYSNDYQGALSTDEYIGLLGNEIMDRFDLIVNVPDSCLYLRPNQNYSLPYTQTFTGFSYVDRTDICNGWVVRSLYEGLAAEKAGLQIGDIIVQVNGRNTQDISREEQKHFFQNIKSPYVLTIERNKQSFRLSLDKV